MFYVNSYTEIKLTENSSIITAELPKHLKMTDEQFNELWKLRPTENQFIKLFGKLVQIPRKNKAYGYTYSFAGITEIKSNSTPDIIQRYMDYCQCNGALVNWYENGEEYIGPHSDDTKQLEHKSNIFTLSFGANRIFRLQHKKNKIYNMDLNTGENDIIVMCGDFQNEYKHSIPKTKKCKDKRISITLRKFI